MDLNVAFFVFSRITQKRRYVDLSDSMPVTVTDRMNSMAGCRASNYVIVMQSPISLEPQLSNSESIFITVRIS